MLKCEFNSTPIRFQNLSEYIYDHSPVLPLRDFMADSALLSGEYAQQDESLDGSIYSAISEFQLENFSNLRCPDGGSLQPDGWTVYDDYDYRHMRSEYGF